jgi:RNA polymerase sigma-70 factor (ECF subfamily)
MNDEGRQLHQPPDGLERSDEDLAASAQAGSLEDFERLVRRHQVRLVRFVGRSLRHADAQDVVQEAFLQAYLNLHRYSRRWRFRTWLLTIARRLTIDQFRLCASRPMPTDLPTRVTIDAPDAALLRDEQRDDLWSTVRRALGDEATTALWLYYVEDLSAVEIGRVLGRSWVWVKTTLHRSRRQLREALGGGTFADGFRGFNEGYDDASRRRREATEAGRPSQHAGGRVRPYGA